MLLIINIFSTIRFLCYTLIYKLLFVVGINQLDHNYFTLQSTECGESPAKKVKLSVSSDYDDNPCKFFPVLAVAFINR